MRTFLFSDIEDSTRRWERNRDAIRIHNGSVFKARSPRPRLQLERARGLISRARPFRRGRIYRRALLIRERADLVDSPDEYKKQIEVADSWVQKALDTKKLKAARAPTTGGIVQDSK